MPAFSKSTIILRHPAAVVCAAVAAMTLSLSPFLAGCGGNSNSGANPSPTLPGSGVSRGRAAFTIVWPERTRVVPTASNSISISLSGAGPEAPFLGTQLVTRPTSGQLTSVITFENMEPGSVVATASAFPSTDGTGTAQASGQVRFTIVPDETVQTSLTMDSTIDHLEISPKAFRFYAGMQNSYGGNVTLTPKNATGEVVLVPISNFKWSSADATNTSVFRTDQGFSINVNKNGPVGVMTFTVREIDSGKTVTLPIDLHGPLYTVTDLGQQVQSPFLVDAYAINETGSIVGHNVINAHTQTVVWKNGVGRTIGLPPGSDYTVGRDINDAGIVAGAGGLVSPSNASGPASRGFIWKPSSDVTGQFIDVPPPPGFTTSPLYSINNQGKAAGGKIPSTSTPGTAFIFDLTDQTSTALPASSNFRVGTPSTTGGINDSGVVVGLGTAVSVYSYQNGITNYIPGLRNAYAINSAGVIAGFHNGKTDFIAAIYRDNQTMFLFPTETTISSIAYAINNKGMAVGAVNNDNTAFVWGPGLNGVPDESTAVYLNTVIGPNSGWDLKVARDINDRGEIVGKGIHNGVYTAFLLTPIP